MKRPTVSEREGFQLINTSTRDQSFTDLGSSFHLSLAIHSLGNTNAKLIKPN